MRWEFQRAQGRLPKFRDTQKNGVSDTPKKPPKFRDTQKTEVSDTQKNALRVSQTHINSKMTLCSS